MNKVKRIGKDDIYNLSAIELYKLVLEGKVIKKFPPGFWQQTEAMNNAIILTKYLIEDLLKLSDKEIIEKICNQLFKQYKLGGMLGRCFNGSPYEAINLAYPNKFKPWEFKMSPMGIWKDKDNIIKATKWLIEDKLKLTDEELKECLSQKLFYENGLRGMLGVLKDSPYEAINLAYPNKFKPWEFKQVSNNYWDDKHNGIKAVKWLIEEKLQLADEELKKILSYEIFTNYGLKGMIMQCFNDSPYEAINLAYPNKFKEWEFNNSPINYWTVENGIKATKWLIEDVLKLNKDELSTINRQTFIDYGLGGMLYICFNNNPQKAIKEYCNKF